MAEELNPLAALIDQYRKRSRETYRTIAERGGLPSATVHSLATKPVKESPKRSTLEKLAAGLQLDLAVVQRAAQEAAGFHVYEESTPDTDTQILIGNYQRLSPAERASVAALVEALLRQHPDTH